MSEKIFNDLKIPKPQINLNAGGGSHTEQTTKIMIGYELVLDEELPHYCLVVGDVNSTMACSIVAKKRDIKIIHIEAGIRSGDLSMPEEINRIVTDSITDYFFTTSETANKNLRNLSIPEERIYFVGNTMIDTLMKHRSSFKKPKIWEFANLNQDKFIVMTLHRPSNVDDAIKLNKIIKIIVENSKGMPIVFPVHPRTINRLSKKITKYCNLFLTESLGYLEFNYLVENSKAVITDSGGITEEATVMNIPCITLRDNTERPETVDLGTNELVGTSNEKLNFVMQKLMSNNWKKGVIPPKWDGKAGLRIVDNLLKLDVN